MKKSLLWTRWILLGTWLILTFFITSATAAEPSPLTISVYGINGDVYKNVMNHLDIYINNLGEDPTDRTVEHFYSEAPDYITNAMAPYGYFKPHITSTIHQDIDNHWYMEFSVDPGEPVLLTEVDLKITGAGATDPEFINYINNYPLHEGDVLNTQEYKKAKSQLLNLATERGYFDTNLSISQIRINLNTFQAQIIMHMDTGPRYKFGPTTIRATYYQQDFLQRFLTYQPNEEYDSSKISTLQENLAESNYFNTIQITPNTNPAVRADPKKEVPIDIYLTPSPGKQYQLGAGYGTDTGIRGLAGLTLRHVTSTGHRFATFIRASEVEDYATANYYIPGENPVTDTYQFGVGAGTQDLPAGNSKNFKVLAGYSTQFGSLQQNTTLTYLNEHYNIPSIFNGTIDTNLIIPAVNWEIKHLDDVLRPGHGYDLTLQLSGASQELGSQTSFFQTLAGAKYLTTLFDDNRLLLRTQLGTTTIDSLNNLPLSLQFFAGGANSVRGYSYKSLGPGRYLFTGSVELQHRIYDNWYVAGFYDAGNVSDNFLPNLMRGIGPGIVWLSPIGPFELTIAKPIDMPQNHWQIQFTMGPEI